MVVSSTVLNLLLLIVINDIKNSNVRPVSQLNFTHYTF